MEWRRVILSGCIAGAGLLGARSLSQVDQEIRVIYAEYTLSATDLGHVNGELIRYRTSVIRAIEADTKKDFQRIADSLPQKRDRIEKAIERFIKAANTTSLGRGLNAEEMKEVRDVKASLERYIESSHHTIDLLEQRWRTASPVDAGRLRDEAERNATEDAAEKFIAITLEIDQLLEAVAKISGAIKEDADLHLRMLSAIVVVVSLALAIFTLFVGPNP